MSQIVLYFSHSTLEVSFYIEVVLILYIMMLSVLQGSSLDTLHYDAFRIAGLFVGGGGGGGGGFFQ